MAGKKMSAVKRAARWVITVVLIAMMLGTAVSAASWADPYLNQLVGWGVMRGDQTGALQADRDITRAEFVAMVNRAYGYADLGEIPFTDVHYNDWFYEDICIAYNKGYFAGTSETTATPNGVLSREQAAALLGRNMMLDTTTGGEVTDFTDSREFDAWSRGAIAAACEAGFISGTDDGSFQPKRAAYSTS